MGISSKGNVALHLIVSFSIESYHLSQQSKIHRRRAEIKLIKNLLFSSLSFFLFHTLLLFPFSYTFGDSSHGSLITRPIQNKLLPVWSCARLPICVYLSLCASLFMFWFHLPKFCFLLRLQFIPPPLRPNLKLMCLTVLKLVWTRIAAPHHRIMVVVEPVYRPSVASVCVCDVLVESSQ